MALRSVGVRLQAEISNYMSNMRRAAGATRGFRAELDKAARAGKLDAVADQAGRMGLALSGGFALAVGAAARFEKQMSSVDAATHATADELRRLSDAAIKAGKDTAFSATEAAQGIEELAKAGVSTADILSGGLDGALALAAAGEVGVGEAAETAASAMTQFGLKGNQVTHIADLLAAGAGKAQGSVSDMAQALNQSGLVAAQTGLNIEETTGALAAFASAGLLGSDAGTSFKTMLLRLAAPTEEAASLMAELGINAFDAQGNFVGMAKFAGILQRALAGMSQEQRLATMNTIFGTDAIRAASITFQQGQSGIQGWIDKVDATGYASDTAARKTDNLVGDVERLTGELESLAIESGGAANGGLRSLVQIAEKLVAQIGAMPPAVTGTAVVVAGLAGAGLLGFSAFVKLREATGRVSDELRTLGPRGERAALVLDKTSKHARRAAAAFIALQVAGAALDALTADQVADVDRLTKSLEELGKTGQTMGELKERFGNRGGLLGFLNGDEPMEGLVDDLNKVSSGFSGIAQAGESMLPVIAPLSEKLFGSSWTSAAENVSALDQALTQLVNAGKLDEARTAFAKLLRESGMNLTDLQKLLPQYTDAMHEAEKATDPVAVAQQRVADRTEIMTRSMLEAVTAGQKLTDIFDGLNGTALDYREQQIRLADVIARATETVNDNGQAWDLSTDAGRENQQVLIDLARQTRDTIQATYDQTQNVNDATRVYEDARRKFVDLATAMTGSRKEAEKLADELLAMPTNVTPTVTVKTPGLEKAIARMNALAEAVARAGGELRIRTSVGGYNFERWGGVTTHAATGALRQAATYSPQSPARYAFAEPATGGEAFVPRNGNRERSMNILATAAGWYGHQVTPVAAGAYQQMPAAAGNAEMRHTLVIEGTGVVSGLRREIRLYGNGDPVTYLRG